MVTLSKFHCFENLIKIFEEIISSQELGHCFIINFIDKHVHARMHCSFVFSFG